MFSYTILFICLFVIYAISPWSAIGGHKPDGFDVKKQKEEAWGRWQQEEKEKQNAEEKLRKQEEKEKLKEQKNRESGRVPGV